MIEKYGIKLYGYKKGNSTGFLKITGDVCSLREGLKKKLVEFFNKHLAPPPPLVEKNDLHAMKRILYDLYGLSDSYQMALLEAVEVQASHSTMILT